MGASRTGSAAKAVRPSFDIHERAIADGSATVSGLTAYARLLVKAGEYARAAQVLDAVLRVRSDDVDVWWLLGTVLRGMGQREAAIGAFTQGAGFKPKTAGFYLDYGKCLLEFGAAESAVNVARRGLEADGADLDLRSLLASALLAVGQPGSAVEEARRVLSRRKQDVAALNTLGLSLAALGDQAGAAATFERALAIQPGHKQSLGNMALALWEECRHSEALHAMVAAAAGSADPRIHKLLAMLRISLGDFTAGWAGYDWRHQARDLGGDPPPPAPPAHLPKWDGVLRPGERVLICGEQGIGDEIMFSGVLPRLLQPGGRFALTCEPRLRPLFLRSFPELQVFARGDYDHLPGDVTAWIWLGDLPGMLRPDRHGSPWLEPGYLQADRARVAELRRRYADGRPLVGVSWRTTNRRSGPKRCLPPGELQRLLSVESVRWVSLQYGNPTDLREIGGERLIVDETVDALADLDIFTAQVAAMDHVVTIDNSTVHIAGGLGVPTMLLLPKCADWRWMVGRTECVWYGSVELCRQEDAGAWTPVIDRVRTAIRSW